MTRRKLMASAQENNPWYSELDDILRAVSGSFLFGIPLLYTEEVWLVGNHVNALYMTLALCITLFLLIILDYGAGFRKKKEYRWTISIMDSLVALAVAVVCASLSLMIIGVLPLDLGLENIVGYITMEAIPFGIGAGISDYLVEGQRTEGMDEPQQLEKKKQEEDRTPRGKLHGTLVDLGATALGAVIIGFTIAPTDEVLLIASRLSSLGMLLINLASLIISYIIVFEASFVSESKRLEQRGIFQHPVVETINSYLAALAVSLFMLWLFQTVATDRPWHEWLSYILVLGFPASIGGAAGRLAV